MVVDVVLDVSALPEPGGDVLATRSQTAAGGGFNVMAAAARLGLAVAYGGAMGSGPFATLARAACAAEGIEVLRPAKPGRDTGFVVSIVDATGERTFLTSRGAEATLTAADLDPVRPLPGQVLAPVLARADWLTCNAREGVLLTGAADPGGALQALTDRLPGAGVLVRVGPDGCLLGRRGFGAEHVPGFSVEAVDTNGAGDTHTGAFLAALASGAPAVEAVRRANAAAAWSVTRRGPATGPSRAELDALLS